MKTLISSLFIVAIFSGLPDWINATKTSSTKELVNSINQMSIDLFKTLLHDETENFVCSPLSVGKVLSMAAYGARGKTKTELSKVLHIIPQKKKILHYASLNILNKLNNILKMADKMYVSEKFEINKNYSEAFKSKIDYLDFKNSENTSKIINNWVESQTNNRIKDLITSDEVKENSGLFFINAIYFKGLWKKKFDKRLTEQKIFHLDKGTTKKVATMTQEDDFNYKELKDIDAKIIELPYEMPNKSGAISMFFIVPNEIEGLKKIEDNIDKINLDTLHDTVEKKIELSLPKFKIQKKIDLKEHLIKMGINRAFKLGANFSGITRNPNMFIGDIVQKAFIEVNEDGTEAAAASAAGISFRMGFQPLKINIDRPFLIILATPNVIIFTARVSDPSL